MKIQRVSRRNEGLILTPHEPVQVSLEVGVDPNPKQAHLLVGANGVGFRPPMGTSHGSKDMQMPGYLQHLWP